VAAADELRSTTNVAIWRSPFAFDIDRIFVGFGSSGGAQAQTVTVALDGVDFRTIVLSSVVTTTTLNLSLAQRVRIPANAEISARVSSATARSIIWSVHGQAV